jgi:hypothetical protein
MSAAAQVLLDALDRRAGGAHRLDELLFGHAQLFGPVVQLPFLMHVDAAAVLLAAIFQIVSHDLSPFGTEVAGCRRTPGRSVRCLTESEQKSQGSMIDIQNRDFIFDNNLFIINAVHRVGYMHCMR